MSMNTPNALNATSLDIDALLQDTYLLVVELREGACAQNGEQLWKFCAAQVERVREALAASGLSQRSVDHICHAQCALLDETVLSREKDAAHAVWASEPLQARFFNRHQAGEFLYEDMREVLREPAPDVQVLTAYQRVLMLGFQGRYRDVDDPERQKLLAAFNERVAPLAVKQPLVTQAGRRRANPFERLRSPRVQGVAAVLAIAGAWWAFDQMLAERVVALMQGQG